MNETYPTIEYFTVAVDKMIQEKNPLIQNS